MTLTNAPILETERLILRGPEPQDLEPLAEFFASRERSWGFTGPKNRNETWRWFAASIGHWQLQGKGYWTITLRGSGEICGITGIWFPDGLPEPELGWVAYHNAEGKGILAEAARAARLHAYTVWQMPPLCSLTYPGNERSIRLAERLGCVHEKDVQTARYGTDHLYRHPGLDQL